MGYDGFSYANSLYRAGARRTRRSIADIIEDEMGRGLRQLAEAEADEKRETLLDREYGPRRAPHGPAR